MRLKKSKLRHADIMSHDRHFKVKLLECMS